jgi:hypothetical protein
VAIQHRDKDHQHVHLVMSRIRLDGSLVHQPWGVPPEQEGMPGDRARSAVPAQSRRADT